ncbi:MAG: carbohydrate ABC transporter permease [Clostridia bacterium]|nr:carbohydrate ABC transporter permease [Clostridia bacterium]
MKIRKSKGEVIFDILIVLFMLLMIVITLYPFWYVITCSLSDSNHLIGDKGLMLLPQGFSFSAYQSVLKNPNIAVGYRNTLFIVVVGTTVNVFMSSLAAFVLTRRQFAIKKVMMTMIIITMYFGGGLVPTYLVVYKYLGLGNTLWALILPGAINTYNMIIMKTNFASIPSSIEESAQIDGANEIVLLFRIVLPLSIPIIAVMVLFYGVAHWNSWFNAMIYIRKPTLYPLQLRLREILLINDTSTMTAGSDASDKYNIGESIKYATIMVATVPILVVYPFIQKYFVKGMMIGAVKG